jgi:hypothetical protein
MSRFIPTIVAAATLAAACAFAPATHAAAACGNSGYSYAGISALSSGSGIGASITALRAPRVSTGHIAAWIGVGGEGLGPKGTSEWLQAGISAEPGKAPALYYEFAQPGAAPRYLTLDAHLTLGKTYRITVIESRTDWWRVSVNGSAATKLIHLPGSHGAWRPVATTESWDGGVAACNAFAFRFADIRAAGSSGQGWLPMESSLLDAPGYRVEHRTLASFDAVGGI